MSLDPQFQAFAEQFAQMPPLSQIPLQMLRAGQIMQRPTERTPVAQVIDRTIPGPAGDIKLRIYRPHAEQGLPLLVFMHGGGFILGDLDSHDEAARQLTMLTDCVTVAVDYRLAPEYPFPAAPEDCFAALKWAAAHAAEFGADPGRIAVAGDSAGGNLAAVMALRARDEGGPRLRGQVLIYPAADLEDANEFQPAPDGNYYLLGRTDGAYFNSLYLREPADARHPHASPMFAEDVANLPPAMVITAEFDPLCRQGEAFAVRLKAAGVPVEQRRYAGAIHGFVSMPVPMAREALGEAAQWLKARFEAAGA
jgi:acetyl esterase